MEYSFFNIFRRNHPELNEEEEAEEKAQEYLNNGYRKAQLLKKRPAEITSEYADECVNCLNNIFYRDFMQAVREIEPPDLEVLWLVLSPKEREMVERCISKRLETLTILSAHLRYKEGIYQNEIDEALMRVLDVMQAIEPSTPKRFDPEHDNFNYRYTEVHLLHWVKNSEKLALKAGMFNQIYGEKDYEIYPTSPRFYQTRCANAVIGILNRLSDRWLEPQKKDVKAVYDQLVDYSKSGKGHSSLGLSGLEYTDNQLQYVTYIVRAIDDQVKVYKRVNLIEYYPDLITEERDDFLVFMDLPYGHDKAICRLNPITEVTYDELEAFLLRR